MVYVDQLCHHGLQCRGRATRSCHLFSDEDWTGDMPDLHSLAQAIGCKPGWLHISTSGVPHYDLTERMRMRAIQHGALEVDRQRACAIWESCRKHALWMQTEVAGYGH